MHAGTYNGGVPAMAATKATLEVLNDPKTWTQLESTGGRLKDAVQATLDDRGIPARVQGWPAVFHVALGVEEPIVDYRSSLKADKARYVKLCTALLERGVRVLERGAWFVSTAHDDVVVDETITALEESLSVV